MAYKIQIRAYAQSWIRNIRELPRRVQTYVNHLHIKRLVKTRGLAKYTQLRSSEFIARAISVRLSRRNVFVRCLIQVHQNQFGCLGCA